MMDNDKSILDKITDTVKDIANIATEAANNALRPEDPPPKPSEQRAVDFMPLMADGLVSDPMMVPPIAVAPVARKKRAASKSGAKQAGKTTAKKTAGKSVRKAAKPATGKS